MNNKPIKAFMPGRRIKLSHKIHDFELPMVHGLACDIKQPNGQQARANRIRVINTYKKGLRVDQSVQAYFAGGFAPVDLGTYEANEWKEPEQHVRNVMLQPDLDITPHPARGAVTRIDEYVVADPEHLMLVGPWDNIVECTAVRLVRFNGAVHSQEPRVRIIAILPNGDETRVATPSGEVEAFNLAWTSPGRYFAAHVLRSLVKKRGV